MSDPDEDSGCGWEWDHTVRPGDVECQECGAEIEWLDEDD